MKPSEPMPTETRRDTLELCREIRATPERVFRAFTTAGELKDWWGKGEWSMTAAKMSRFQRE